MPISVVAGQMRKTVVIQQRTSTPDTAGEPGAIWATFITRRAAIVRLPGVERWIAQGRVPKVPTTFVMRYPRTVKVFPQMRLVCDGVIYDIISAIDPDGMKAELQLTCMELTNEPTV